MVDDNTNLPENVKPIDETETKQNESDTHEETPDVAEKTQPTNDIETKDSEHEETPDVAEKAQLTNDIEAKDSEKKAEHEVAEQQQNDTEKETSHSDQEDKNNVAEEEKVRNDTETKQDESNENDGRKAKPTTLVEPDPILKAFGKVHTMEEALTLLDVSDNEKPQKSVAIEINIKMELGVMNMKFIGLKPHVKKERKFSCPHEGCEEFKPTQGQLNIHLEQVHKATFPCQKCVKTYETANGLNKHYKKHFKFTNICAVCEKGFQFPKQLAIHEGIHRTDNVGKFLCPTRDCKKVLLSKQGLEAYRKLYEEQRFKCEPCDKTFNMELCLRQHITGKHGEGCYSYCGKHFQWPDTKYRHQCECDKCKTVKAEKENKPEFPNPIFRRRKQHFTELTVSYYKCLHQFYLW